MALVTPFHQWLSLGGSMTLTASREAGHDLCYLTVNDAPVAATKEVADGVHVDVTADGSVVGVETLHLMTFADLALALRSAKLP